MTANDDPLDLGPPGPVLGLRAFRCGDWNDVPTDAGTARDLKANFTRFVAPVDSGNPSTSRASARSTTIGCRSGG